MSGIELDPFGERALSAAAIAELDRHGEEAFARAVNVQQDLRARGDERGVQLWDALIKRMRSIQKVRTTFGAA